MLKEYMVSVMVPSTTARFDSIADTPDSEKAADTIGAP